MDRRTFLTFPIVSAALPSMSAASAVLSRIPSPEASFATAPENIDFTANLPAPGTLPERWICGSSSCMDNQDPPIQVHWYNEHTVFMRQNKAYSYEAPFMHVYFGNERTL